MANRDHAIYSQVLPAARAIRKLVSVNCSANQLYASRAVRPQGEAMVVHGSSSEQLL